VFGMGDHFAEVPVFDGKPFPASAEALEPAQALFFPRELFLELLEQHPSLTINLLKGFARHLRHFSQLVDTISLKEVPGRLAAYILTLSEQASNTNQVELDLNKGQLAARLGTVPETLSRVLYRLSQEGILEVAGTKVTLTNREALEKLRD